MGFGDRAIGRGLGLRAMMKVCAAQTRDSREKSVPARGLRDHCCGDLPTLCACRQQDTASVNARGEMGCGLSSQRWTSRLAATRACARDGGQSSMADPRPRGWHDIHCSLHQAVSRQKSLPIPVQLGAAKGPSTWASSAGGADDLPEAVVTSYRSLLPQVFLAHPNCVCHIAPSAQTDLASEPQ